MMRTNTETKTLKRFAPTIVKEQNSQSESGRRQRLLGHGVPRTPSEALHIVPLQEPCGKVIYIGSLVSAAGKKSQSPIMRITTNLLMWFGFANRVINNGIKN